jgi:UDP-N-acetylglucosamine/UDP-N-acetylgalactosamine diphosphorylase
MNRPSPLPDRLQACGQAHLVEHLRTLDDDARERLWADLEAVDLELLARLFSERAPEPAGSRIEPLPGVVKGADRLADRAAREVGEALIREGRVAAYLVAGGQGTRLGHPGPKGTYPATPIGRKPLFRIFAERLRSLARRTGRLVPLWVLTSPGNHHETLAFFRGQGCFGLPADSLHFVTQGTLPALDPAGRLILAAPDRLFRSPDGHGGSLEALRRSGALEQMESLGVEELFYFQVDNPLVEVADPVFLGHHRLAGSEFSSKAVPKVDPDEKVGVLVRRDGRPGVIEYSDLPDELRQARDADGRLRFRAGNIAVHAISRTFVERLTTGGLQLPWHRARKAIPAWEPGVGQRMVEGVKFETFVFDAMESAGTVLVMEVDREAEFSPIKNREGRDSPATAADAQVALHAAWLEAAGVTVPRDASGRSRHRIEISPLFALDAGELCTRRRELPARLESDLQLGPET